MIATFVFSSLIGFADAAQLSIIIRQNQEQIEQIKNLIDKTQMSVDEAKQAHDLLRQLTSGVDQSLDLLKNSKDFAETIQKLQQKDNYKNLSFAPQQSFDHLQEMTKNAKKPVIDKDEFSDFQQLQKTVSMANSADLKSISNAESMTDKSTPYDLQRITASSSLAQWKSIVRLSSQLAEMVSQMRSLREEVLALRLKEETENDDAANWITEALETSKPKK